MLAEQAKIYAENIVATVREPLLVLDDKFRVSSANDAFYEKFQVRADETEGQLLYELSNAAWDIPELRRLLSELLPRDQRVDDFEMEHDFVVAPGADPSRIRLRFSGDPLLRVDADGGLIVSKDGRFRLGSPFLYQNIEGGKRATFLMFRQVSSWRDTSRCGPLSALWQR